MDNLVVQNTELTHDVGFTDEVSWVAPADLTIERYLSIANTFQQIQRSLGWWYGDLLVEGERLFGEASTQAIPDIGRGTEALLKYKAVSIRVPREIRQKDLSWTHHLAVCYIEEDQRGPLLEMALNMALSSRELKEVTKLSWDLRQDLITAAEEGMERADLMRLINQFKMNDVGTPPALDDDEEEDVPFTDMGDDEEEDYSPPAEEKRDGMSCEDIYDYWENAGAGVTFCGLSEVIWGGIAVHASIDENGRSILIWEQIP